ncbi:hypothetical protein LTR36_007646 [Oleoguttula mirabilis]|uniref:Uncharacterized protein n=1 Tax=Oleoguttula mirabilis TaxID=1507867 RepID=A0AAV9JUH6_9PEZI|nr:hypothetical protein LTR36_007646 [Oleoguttula mirabilis]
MSPPSPAPGQGTRTDPKVQHSFDGDVKILNGTLDSRMEIRKALQNLQQILQRSETYAVQVVADVKLRISGPDAKEHTYTVIINDDSWDDEAFARKVPASTRKDGSGTAARTVAGAAGSLVAAQVNGQRRSPVRSESRVIADDDDDVVEVRPSKKARMDADDSAMYTSRSQDTDTDGLLREMLALLKQRSSNDPLEFIKQWHTEWVKQGGWLFDTLNKAEKATKDSKDSQVALHARVGAAQDVLGQSLNAASASTMAELGNISKLIPWLEHCRKTSDDKVQAREEKWRSSSATFHDQSRHDREAAEKKLELELQKHRALLVKLAEFNGVDIEEEEELGGKDEERDREVSLGAQLTAELNMEASRAVNSSKTLEERPRETINIDDD